MAITLFDMLKRMQAGEVFSCTVISFDKKRKQGGSIVEYAECRLYEPELEQTRQRPATLVERQREQLRTGRQRPNHGLHFTRNIVLLVDGFETAEIRKIHPPLVVKFNDEIVLG